MKKMFNKTAVAVALGTAAVSSFAAGPTAGDLSNLTPDLTTVIAAIGAVAAVMLGKDLAILGYRVVKRLFAGA